jgi:hypothetical protein
MGHTYDEYSVWVIKPGMTEGRKAFTSLISRSSSSHVVK